MVFSYFVRYRVVVVGVMLEESLSAPTGSRIQTFCKVSPFRVHPAVIVKSSHRDGLTAEQWVAVQVMTEFLQEAQHIRHTVHCRQC